MTHLHRNFLVALAGQPNVGKSTIFNMLTGAHQHVANFPGVTVEKKQGRYKDGEHTIELVDLPGTYSLTSYTQEERIARDFILLERPEVVVVVVDASNLERNLYLTFQLREMEVPLVLCVNMMDVAERRGIKLHADRLSEQLKVPVIPVVGKKNKGRDELRRAILDICLHANHEAEAWMLDYGEVLEPVIQRVAERLSQHEHLMEDFSARWLAVKLMENDSEARRIVLHHTHDDRERELCEYVEEQKEAFTESNKRSAVKIIATQRYRKASRIVKGSTERTQKQGQTLTDRADSILLHRALGPVLLALILFVFYQITMNLGTRLSDAMEPVTNLLRVPIVAMFPQTNLIRSGMLESLLLDGVVSGVSTLLYYVPLFFVLFSMLAVLEDSGYLARIAFILDRVFRAFGLHGQSTLPLILGGIVAGGCAVPGVMATRAMKDEKAKLVTILIMPLMNCAAKIPIFAMIIATWVSDERVLLPGVNKRGLAMFGLSFFSFLVAMLIAKLFSKYVVKGRHAPFVLELPNYHLPTFSGVVRRAVQRIWSFMKKLFTVIILVQILVWFFISFPGIGQDGEAAFDSRLAAAEAELMGKLPTSGHFHGMLQDRETRIMMVFDFLKARESMAEQGIEPGQKVTTLPAVGPDAFLLANHGVNAQGRVNKEAQEAAVLFESYVNKAVELKMERQRKILRDSFAGRLGRFLEPMTQLAGFDWRMNISIVSSFAARENLIGTLGTICNVEFDEDGSLGDTIRKFAPGWTGWHTLSLLIFVALLPPCIPTILTIRAETGSRKWAAFTTVYPLVLGFILALIVFQLGPRLFG